MDRPWDPQFFTGDPAFDAVRSAAERFSTFDAWPSVEDIDRVLSDLVPVRFVVQPPKTRKRHTPIDAESLYDGRITVDHVVPTRLHSWHDLLNALVWASFPRSKRALHTRLYLAMKARVSAPVMRLPNARTREQDHLAMIDEGGVIVLRDPYGAEQRLVFGHAILEHRLADQPARAREIPLHSDTAHGDLDDRRRIADIALAHYLETGGS